MQCDVQQLVRVHCMRKVTCEVYCPQIEVTRIPSGSFRSCLIELQTFPLSKLYIDPVHRVLMSSPLFLLIPCKTWFGQVQLLRIFVILMHGIHGCEEYRLSVPARILSSRYKS